MRKKAVKIMSALLAVASLMGYTALSSSAIFENIQNITDENNNLQFANSEQYYETFYDSIAVSDFAEALDAKSVILMEASTGTVLVEKNADEALPPASVTKVMTMLLVMEAIDGGKITLSDMVTVSERAASMGGSQVFLKVGEQMTVEDMLKSVVISSANDAAVALAEFVAGSEDAFVEMMNQRAKELGMNNTVFENTNGLDDDVTTHLTSARDIAIMSRELITKHPKILEYSSIWMDTIRDGAFGLTNTNRLVRFYSGANGLKTGSTSKAKFCISATAQRDGMQLIAVIMGAPNRDVRNEIAKRMLDHGFANYSLYKNSSTPIEPIKVLGGTADICGAVTGEFSMVLPKGSSEKVERIDITNDSVTAPVKAGDVVGYSEFRIDGDLIGKCDIYASDNVDKIGYFAILFKLMKKILLV